jgi:antagonist of KipI
VERGEVFHVLNPGILTTVQDLGRFGFSHVGVPPSGALDSFSLRIGNLLVGNEEGEAGLETTIMGLKLKAKEEVVIAITGGDLFPTLNGQSLEMWRSHLLVEGDLLAFKGVRKGCRAYVAIGGGIAVPKIMGSKSTFLSGGFGGLKGRALKREDVLHTADFPIPLDKIGVRFPVEWIPVFEKEATLRVIPGPQDQHFTALGFQAFQTSSYQVTAKSDRMGIRLEGPEIERRPDKEESIISEGLIPGALQVPGDGKPIIILNELVSGGYTKIATIISTDLTEVAQLKPGDRVRFEPIQVEEAHQILRKKEERVQRFKESLQHSPATT